MAGAPAPCPGRIGGQPFGHRSPRNLGAQWPTQHPSDGTPRSPGYRTWRHPLAYRTLSGGFSGTARSINPPAHGFDPRWNPHGRPLHGARRARPPRALPSGRCHAAYRQWNTTAGRVCRGGLPGSPRLFRSTHPRTHRPDRYLLPQAARPPEHCRGPWLGSAPFAGLLRGWCGGNFRNQGDRRSGHRGGRRRRTLALGPLG